MLILVAVVIGTAMSGNGIIKNAQDAKSKYEAEQEREKGEISEIIDNYMNEETTLTPTDQKYLLFTHDETNGKSTFKGMNPDYLMDNGYYGEGDYVITDLVIPSVVLNESGEESLVTEIGTNVGPAGNNSTIKTIVLPDTIENITPYSFCYWTALTTIKIPSVTKIGTFAFSGCTSLTTITLPNGATTLMGPTFADCTSLTSVYLPSSINSIAGGCFSGCSSDLKIYVDKYESECSGFNSGWSGNATVIYKIKQEADESRPVDLKYFRIAEMGDGATVVITGFNQEYKLPDGNYGEDNYIITDLIIPSKGIVNGTEQTVVGIISSSFRACSTIKTLVIPETVETIQPYAFYDCTNLIKVEIPSNVTTIGANVFGGCSSDLKIYIDKYESECSGWPSNWFGSAKEVIYKTEQ